MFGLSNLVNTEVNLPVDGPTLGESQPEEAGQLCETEMVNIVTSPAQHPEQPQLRPQQVLHLVVGLGSQEIILGGLGKIQGNAN